MRFSFFSLVTIALIATPLKASTANNSHAPLSLFSREHQVMVAPEHRSEFADVPHSTRASCEASEPPQELVTPDPVLSQWSSDKIEVSFIVGTDGKVHSPLVLESAGAEQDGVVLKTISKWRFRPATCNGVATDAEAKIGFSAR
jgi:TonB family protein